MMIERRGLFARLGRFALLARFARRARLGAVCLIGLCVCGLSGCAERDPAAPKPRIVTSGTFEVGAEVRK